MSTNGVELQCLNTTPGKHIPYLPLVDNQPKESLVEVLANNRIKYGSFGRNFTICSIVFLFLWICYIISTFFTYNINSHYCIDGQFSCKYWAGNFLQCCLDSFIAKSNPQCFVADLCFSVDGAVLTDTCTCHDSKYSIAPFIGKLLLLLLFLWTIIPLFNIVRKGIKIYENEHQKEIDQANQPYIIQQCYKLWEYLDSKKIDLRKHVYKEIPNDPEQTTIYLLQNTIIILSFLQLLENTPDITLNLASQNITLSTIGYNMLGIGLS